MTIDHIVYPWYQKGKCSYISGKFSQLEYLIYGRGISNQDIWQKSGKGTIFLLEYIESGLEGRNEEMFMEYSY